MTRHRTERYDVDEQGRQKRVHLVRDDRQHLLEWRWER